MNHPDNVDDLEQLRADDQLIDHAGSTDPDTNDAITLLRDLANEGARR